VSITVFIGTIPSESFEIMGLRFFDKNRRSGKDFHKAKRSQRNSPSESLLGTRRILVRFFPIAEPAAYFPSKKQKERLLIDPLLALLCFSQA
jgi:hypothetical protein